jgi:tetratricopeptide (TPR) repeat protein
LRVVEGNEVTATLRLMGRDPGQSLALDVAQDVATRIGAKAVLVGDVAPLGSGYVLTARLVAVADSVTLLAERSTAADASALIPAVEALSRTLREKIGESLRTVRESQPLERVTTRSLAALRAYSEGSRLTLSGRTNDGLRLLEQAVALDSNFGMAWRRIAVTWNNRGAADRAIPAMRRAYALRDQMPPQEAAHVTAFYQSVVNDDIPATIEAYERLLATWPDDISAINNLAVYYGALNRTREASALYQRALELRPGTALYLSNLVQTLIQLKETDRADSLLTVWAPHDSSANQWVPYFRARFEAERGDYERAYHIVDSVAKTDTGFRWVASDLYLRQGRLRAASVRLLPRNAALVEAFIRGNTDAARRMLEAIEARTKWDSLPPSDPRPYSRIAMGYASIGSIDRAEALLARQARAIPPEVLRRDFERAYALAAITLARGSAAEALQQFRRARLVARCQVCTAFAEAQAFEKLSQPDSAIAQYERFVNGHDTDAENREFFLAAALRRLGEMYESKGDRKMALEYYGRFVDLWKDADPELQPLVADIRKQMAQLAGEPPR